MAQVGRGQTHVLAGSHFIGQDFYRYQVSPHDYATLESGLRLFFQRSERRYSCRQVREGGPVGPEGPGWPRVTNTGEDGAMWLGFPQKMRDELINRGVETRPSGGWDYPKPVPVLMEEGGKSQ